MKKQIGNFDNMELVDTIILDGIVDDVYTGDETSYTIGVKNILKTSTFSGKKVSSSNSCGFAFSKEMEDKIGWGTYFANVRFVTSKHPINPETAIEDAIINYFGKADAEYSMNYSDMTGYLWTDEGFTVGGHDLIDIMKSYRGQYIHMEIELYKEKEQ